MRGGVDKNLCLVALLFICSRAEDAVSSEDLKSGLPEEDSKSAALQSSAYSDADSSENDNVLENLKSSKSASAGAYASGGQASAQAQSGLWENSLRPGLSSPGLSSSSVLAEAIAETSGGINGVKTLPYQPGFDLNLYGPSAPAQAEAQALANSGIGGNLGTYGPGNTYPLTLGSGSSSAQALANSVGGSSLYAPATNPYQQGYQQPYKPVYPGGQGSSALAQAQVQADALTQLSGENLKGQGYPGYQYPLPMPHGINAAGAQADAQAISGGYGLDSNAQAQAIANSHGAAKGSADAYSRVIPHHEYVMPHLIPGAEDTISCTREGELHYFWSSTVQCMVCTCIRDLGSFRPVCARCDGCMTPVPEPMPEPDPYLYPVTVAPVLQPLPPVPQVTCSPLPSGQPFQNPLNPCQICICKETLNWQGEPDVHIDCQQNPECIIPPDMTPIPPLPDIPVPVPLPVCDKFPVNVLFPHPTDVCKVCKCIVESIGLGTMEPKILCMSLPECLPRTLPPVPELITLPPMPSPVPIPSEPIPWPPATPTPIPGPTPGPIPGPGPLPGPSPHESCRPFPPNSPFQHPWDECQVCMCAEAFSYGRITIEVNCFTKKSCCYEPPYPEPVTVAPGPYIPTPSIQIIDKICEYRSFGVEFLNPTDKCSLCICELQGNLVTSVCKRSQAPECLIIYYSGGSGNAAEAKASAVAQAGSSSYNPLIINGLPNSQALAEANAIAQSSVQSGLQLPQVQPWLKPELQPGLKPWAQPVQSNSQPWLQPDMPLKPSQVGQYLQIPGRNYGQTGSSQASASALAEAQANQYQAPNIGNIFPLRNQPSLQGNALNLLSNNPSFTSEAEATANAFQGYNQLPLNLGNTLGNILGNSQKQLPYYLGNSNQLGLNNKMGGGYNVPLISPIRGGASALADAEALANTISGNFGLQGGVGQGSSVATESKANAQAVSDLMPGGSALYPAGSPLTLYQSPYLKQGYQTSSAFSQAQASSSSGQSQALASATSGIRKQGKSAREVMESTEDGS